MKATVLAAFLLLASVAATAKELTVTLHNVRSDKGRILAMAETGQGDKPVYGMAQARTDSLVVITLTGIVAPDVTVSLFHDEDGDFKMKMGDRGPEEGFAREKCTLPKKQNAITLKLRYPSTDR